MEEGGKDQLIVAMGDELLKMTEHLSKVAERKMNSETDGLSLLGSKTKYEYQNPCAAMLEVFPNPHPRQTYTVYFETDEFTSLCPKTGQPDFATIQIEYDPDIVCVETKSLKLYLFAYRQVGAFMEDITNKILTDLVETTRPRRIRIRGKFAPRGGIALEVAAEWSQTEEAKGMAFDEVYKQQAEAIRTMKEMTLTMSEFHKAMVEHIAKRFVV